jgi:phosphatidylglycerol:prolipoprotein diacylglycerol transferase
MRRSPTDFPCPKLALSYWIMATSERATPPSLHDALQSLANWTVLFRVGEYIFVTLGLFAAIGAFLGGLWASTLLLGQGFPLLDVALLLAGILVGHIVFARAFLLLWRLPDLLQRTGETLRTVEFASWGGFIAVVAGVALYAVLSSRSLLLLIDVVVLAGTLAHAVGRIGCLTFGCCFGRPSESPLAVRYDNPLAKAAWAAGLRGTPLHPVPLYEAAFILFLFLVLNGVALAGSREGVPAALYLVMYGSGRFLLEFLRYDSANDHIGPLLRNQWLSLLEASAGVVLLVALSTASGPASPSIGEADAQALILLPLLAVCAVIVFLAYSLHRGSIGRW